MIRAVASTLCIITMVVFVAARWPYFHDYVRQDVRPSPPPPLPPSLRADDDSEVFLFAQVSDLHFSAFREHERVADFAQFVNKSLPLFGPELVICTGDLTDAKDALLVDSLQHNEEWSDYARVIAGAREHSWPRWYAPGAPAPMPLLIDLRGNHDAFDVPEATDSHYQRHAAQGPTSFPMALTVRPHKCVQDAYRFLFLDAAPNPGARRPLNFFGVLTNEELQRATDLVLRSTDSRAESVTQTIGVAHYPLNAIWSPGGRLSDLAPHLSVFLSGHLHSLLDYAPVLHARHPYGGPFEAELADWQHGRRFRLAAFDHGLFSFIDVDASTLVDRTRGPLVLITHPKDARLLNPAHEPVHLLSRLSHIRMFVFPSSVDATVVSVSLSIDGVAFPPNALHPVRPGALFYTCPWPDMSSLSPSASHDITVEARDSLGRVTTRQHTFVLDGRPRPIAWLADLVLLTHFGWLLRFIFAALVFVAILLLTLPLRMDLPPIRSTVTWWRCLCSPRCLLSFFVPLCRRRDLQRPLLVYVLYMVIGPTFAGELVRGQTALVFAHGMLFLNLGDTNAWSFVPLTDCYFYASRQLVLVFFPMLFALGALARRRTDSPSSCLSIQARLALGAFLLHEAYACYYVSRWYGAMAALASPGKSWFLIMVCVLLYRSV